MVQIWKRSRLDKIRFFSASQKNALWIRCKGKCELCRIGLVPYIGQENSAEADHIVAWVNYGKTVMSNGQMLCKRCNRDKGSK